MAKGWAGLGWEGDAREEKKKCKKKYIRR